MIVLVMSIGFMLLLIVMCCAAVLMNIIYLYPNKFMRCTRCSIALYCDSARKNIGHCIVLSVARYSHTR